MTGQQPAITMTGRPWQPMRNVRTATDDQLALATKRILWDAGTTKTSGRTRDAVLVAAVRQRLPAAVERFGETAIVAAGRGPGCSWCALRVIAAADLEGPEPDPTLTATLKALLGRQCGRCSHHYAVQEVARREQALAAAGHQRLPDGRLRSPGGETRVRRVGVEPTVRQQIELARARQRQRERERGSW
jgi:hypothetical protein